MFVAAEDPMYDWNSLEIHTGGVIYPGIKEVKYDDELSAALQYGQGARPIGRTLGTRKLTASIVMYAYARKAFLAALGQGFMRKIFAIVVKASVPGSDLIVDTLQRCRIIKISGGASRGDDPLECPMDILPMGILWNGLDPLGDPYSNAA